MGDMEIWSIIILIVVCIILYYKGLRKVRNAFYDQCSLYQDGVPMNRLYHTSEELCEDFLKCKQKASAGEEGRVYVYGERETHTFYLENGKVKYEYPKEFEFRFRLVIHKTRRVTQQLKLIKKTKIVIEANEIMDNLRTINGTDTKNKYYSAWADISSGKKMVVSSFISAILAVIIILKLAAADGVFDNFFEDNNIKKAEVYYAVLSELDTYAEEAGIYDYNFSDYENWRVKYVKGVVMEGRKLDCTGEHDIYKVYVDMEYYGKTESMVLNVYVPSHDSDDHFHWEVEESY